MAANEIDAALDQAVAVLQGGWSGPGWRGCCALIETWEQRLAASEKSELIPISDNLADLRSDTGAPVADRLPQLSSLLTDQGTALANR